MDDQANRPHRKTKEKKKHAGICYPDYICRRLFTESVPRLESESFRIRKSGAIAKASSTLTRCVCALVWQLMFSLT